MPEILHAWALAPAAIGTCCLAADRGRVRVPELLASILMLVAMLDAALTHAVPAVVWATVLIGSAIALAALRSPRRRRARRAPADIGMLVHTTVGMVAMAALQLSMLHAETATGGGHVHGVGRGLLDGLLIGGSIAYAVFSAVLAARAHTRLDRAQDVAMGASVCLMAAGLVL